MFQLARRTMLSLVLGLGALTAVAANAAPAPPPPPAGANPMAVDSGAYAIDPAHSSVVARVPHAGGVSYNVLRFPVTGGSLTWDPARVEAAQFAVTLDATPRTEPVVYGQDLKGANFMNVGQFPAISFVSTGVRRTGLSTGIITGNLTVLGQTKPAVIEARLVGASKNANGVSTAGFTGTMKVNRDDFGLKFMGGPLASIEVAIDALFTRGGN